MNIFRKIITNYLFLEDIIPNKVDFIFVLGNNFEETMVEVKRLYDLGISEKIVISGLNEKGDDNLLSEAKKFKQKGISLGIPVDKFILEEKSTNTLENIIFSKEIINKNHIKFNHKKVLIVCKAFHTRRVLKTLKKHFFKDFEYFFHGVVDDNNISKKDWFKNDFGRKRVYAELKRILIYSLKGDI